jgi:hypothetical protein
MERSSEMRRTTCLLQLAWWRGDGRHPKAFRALTKSAWMSSTWKTPSEMSLERRSPFVRLSARGGLGLLETGSWYVHLACHLRRGTDLNQTFRYDDAMPFAQIAASEHAMSGTSIMYASFVPRMYATICTQTVLYNAFIYQPFVRLMNVTQASSRTRKLYRLSKGILQSGSV